MSKRMYIIYHNTMFTNNDKFINNGNILFRIYENNKAPSAGSMNTIYIVVNVVLLRDEIPLCLIYDCVNNYSRCDVLTMFPK